MLDQHELIAALKAEIENLQQAVERCRKIARAAKAGVGLGVICLALSLLAFKPVSVRLGATQQSAVLTQSGRWISGSHQRSSVFSTTDTASLSRSSASMGFSKAVSARLLRLAENDVSSRGLGGLGGRCFRQQCEREDDSQPTSVRGAIRVASAPRAPASVGKAR
jgi:hypothetical protein